MTWKPGWDILETPQPPHLGIGCALLAALFLLLWLLLLSGCASVPVEERWAIGAEALDLATTSQGLAGGAEELNPLFGGHSDSQALITAAVATIAIHLIIRHWLNEYPSRSKLTWRSVTALRFGAAAWNYSQIEGY